MGWITANIIVVVVYGDQWLGNYLTAEQIARAQEELSLIYALPYANDLVGTAWEQILADIKGGQWLPIRDNRPRPDFTTQENGVRVNYSVKTEGLRLSKKRSHARAYLGHHEDFIIARPKIDDLLQAEETIANLDANDVGAKVLDYYNDQIVKRFDWTVISFLLRLNAREFIYWEERPPTIYNPTDYWWQDSGRATGQNRNVNGFPHSVSQRTTPLPRAKFKFTSGGKQFYILYRIPQDADIWTITVGHTLTTQDLRAAIRQWLEAKRRVNGQAPIT